MKRFSMMIIAAALGAAALQAQSMAVGELNKSYEGIKKNLIAAAEAVPEGDLSFKPTPEMRSLGALISHIADASVLYCSAASGKPERPKPAENMSKAEVVAKLKSSFEKCDPVFGSMTDAQAGEEVNMGRMGSKTKIGLLIAALVHDNEEYGYMAVYLRLKGITPPSSAPRK